MHLYLSHKLLLGGMVYRNKGGVYTWRFVTQRSGGEFKVLYMAFTLIMDGRWN
jgi:hypothetical protein